MDRFFLCFGGRPSDGELPNRITELSENIALFNLSASAGGLTSDELRVELSSRGLLYPHNPNLSIEIPNEDPQYPHCWGILIGLDEIGSVEKHLFLLELYTGHVFTPIYYIDRLGKPECLDYLFPRYRGLDSCWGDNLSRLLDERFPAFLHMIMPLMDTIGSIQMADINKWLLTSDDERFKFLGGLTMYMRLRGYSYGKDPIFWIQEALDIGIILEVFLGNSERRKNTFWSRFMSYFNRGEAVTINKILRTRARAMLGGKKTSDIVYEIYDYRSRFAHGSFTEDLKNSYESTDEGFARMKFNPDIFEKTRLWQQVLRKIVIMEIVLIQNCAMVISEMKSVAGISS